MRLTEIEFSEAAPIDGYGPGFFRIGGGVRQGAVLLLPRGISGWGGYDDTAPLLDAAGTIDVLFVGTGAETAHPPDAFRRALEDAGIGVEAMASAPACRTYNVLLSEGRRIGAALLPVQMLTVDGLSCARGGMRLLEGVGFRVDAGQALVLRGPNGIGKTTLLRTLVGLQRAVEGTVSVPKDAFVYAGHADAVKPTLSVAENLAFWAQVFGAPSIEPALEAFDLRALSDRPGGELSAGQHRRLGLARLVLAGRPIWALDEPTVALDTANVARFADAVRAHLAGGGAAIIATHIDLGLDAETLDLTPFRARADITTGGFDEAFL